MKQTLKRAALATGLLVLLWSAAPMQTFASGAALKTEKPEDQTLKDLNQKIEAATDNAQLAKLHYTRGKYYLKHDEGEKGVADFSAALNLWSEKTDKPIDVACAHYGRALLYIYLEQDEKALDDFNAAIRLWPANGPSVLLGDFHYYRAYLHKGDNKQELKTADLEAALRLWPVSGRTEEKTQAYVTLGTNHALLENYHQAIADYDAALKLTPDSKFAQYGKAYVLQLMKDKGIK